MLRRCSSWAPVVHSQLRPPPRIDIPQRNKHNMQRAKSSFIKTHCGVRPPTNHRPLQSLFKGCCNRWQQTEPFISASQTDAWVAVGCLSFTTRCTDRGSPHICAIKQAKLAESFNQCVPYEKKGSQWTAVTDAVTLHITKDMLLVLTVEMPEVHPHAENV